MRATQLGSAQRDWPLARLPNLKKLAASGHPLLFLFLRFHQLLRRRPASHLLLLPSRPEIFRGLGSRFRSRFDVSYFLLCIMFRPAARALARASTVAVRTPASTRLISTSGPASKSRSWKNTLVRLGLAGGAIYYYNTSSTFAQEPSCTSCRLTFPSFLRTRCKQILGSVALLDQLLLGISECCY